MDVGLISPARWSSFRLSKHFVALALAELGHRVLYVDPPVSIASVVRQRDRMADLLGPRHESPRPGIRVWRPLAVPGQNSSFGQRINGALLRRGIAKELGGTDLAVAFSLEARSLLKTLTGRRVYYCTDSFEDLPGVEPSLVRQREQALVAAADVVVACSRPLVDQLTERGARVVYVPHGCDDDAFDAPASVPEELSGRPRPYVGYVGNLNFRLDPELLDAAARAADGGTLVLIGGTFGPSAHANVDALARRSGVVTIGQRSPAELPGVIAALDAGIAPYARSAFNRKSFPIKIPQYLAAGVPVVSTPNGATDELVDVVRVAEGPEAFEAAVRQALQDTSASARAARVTAARRRPWRVVAAELLAAAAGP